MDTQLTLDLLNQLKRFIKYIERPTADFRDGESNALVHRRLEIVRDAYRGGGFKSDPAHVFVALAEAAYLEIPPLTVLATDSALA
jgi:hypothetical protein